MSGMSGGRPVCGGYDAEGGRGGDVGVGVVEVVGGALGRGRRGALGGGRMEPTSVRDGDEGLGTAAGEPLVKDCFDRRGDNWGGDWAGVETLPRLCGCWKVTEGGVRGLLTELWRSGL